MLTGCIRRNPVRDFQLKDNKWRRKNMMKGSIKKALPHLAGFIALLAVFIWCAASVYASPSVRKTEYEGAGKIEVTFKSAVRYGSVAVKVKDHTGKNYRTKVIDKDRNDLEFLILNYKSGRNYSFRISGIRKPSEKSWGNVTGTVRIPSPYELPKIKKVSGDVMDREVEFEFDSPVQWKKASVTILLNGRNIVRRIVKKDRDEIEVKVYSLTKGKTYRYIVKGVRRKGGSKYYTVSGTFTA